MTNLVEATSYIRSRYREIRSDRYDAFVRKSKLGLRAPVIHVAGSNGKGSTCFYLTEIAAKKYGDSVGTLYNSFFDLANEAICLGGKPIKEEKFLSWFNKGLPLFEKFEVTGFEILVYIAYNAFEDAGVSLAILECGMGGSDDPTNIDGLDTRLALVTNVSLEHTEYLGTTPSEIAWNISGIIKKGVPVIIGAMDENSLDALREVAAREKTSLTRVERPYLPHIIQGIAFQFDYSPYKGIVLPTLAHYQVANACMALEATKNCPLLALDEEDIRSALSEGTIPGRLEKKGNVYLDCASNPAAIESLYRCIQTIGRGRPVHVLFGSKTSSNLSVMLPLLDDAASNVVLTSFQDEEARGEEGYALYIEDHLYIENPLMALMHLQMTYPNDPILITGSATLIAEMKKAL